MITDRDIAVRVCREADLAAVYEIERVCFGAVHALPLLSLTQYRDLCGPGFVVADAGGAVVGYAAAGVVLSNPADLAWILGVAVSPEFQGRRAGPLLCSHIIEKLPAFGVARVRATVAPANSPSLKMFEKLGFHVIADQPDYFGPGERRLVLERLLA